MEQVTGTKHSKEYMLTVDTAKQVKIASEYVGLVGIKHGVKVGTKTYDSRKSLTQIRELFDNGEGALLEGTLDLSR